MTDMLFDIPPTPPRKKEWEIVKEKYGILTHYNKDCEYPWLALLPYERDKGRDIGDVMSESCVTYEEAERIREAETEEGAVLLLATNCKLTLTLSELAAH